LSVNHLLTVLIGSRDSRALAGWTVLMSYSMQNRSCLQWSA